MSWISRWWIEQQPGRMGCRLKARGGKKYVTVFPEYPISILQMDELKRYRRKMLHAQVEVPALIPVLNGPSRILRTMDGHHVNKAFIVALRDYVDPVSRKSRLAAYERRTQINLYVSLDLTTLEEVSGIISVRKVTGDLELCLERALLADDDYEFIGLLTDWNTTEKLDNLIDPVIMGLFEKARLEQSFLAVNKRFIKNYFLLKVLGPEGFASVLEPPEAME